jgi:Tfp pilus assembly protein PilO
MKEWSLKKKITFAILQVIEVTVIAYLIARYVL